MEPSGGIRVVSSERRSFAMTKAGHAPHEHGHSDRRHSEREGRPQVRKDRSQGIVRDQRGQEQPADKERAQRVSKSE
jgi:hypothetical protein